MSGGTRTPGGTFLHSTWGIGDVPALFSPLTVGRDAEASPWLTLPFWELLGCQKQSPYLGYMVGRWARE